MKAALVIVGIVILGLGIAACSLRHGSDANTEMATAIELEGVIKLLNYGQTNEAKNLLDLKMDTVVIEIDLALGRSDEKTRRRATNLLQKIADMRREFPPNESNMPVQVQGEVSRILKQASKSVLPPSK